MPHEKTAILTNDSSTWLVISKNQQNSSVVVTRWKSHQNLTREYLRGTSWLHWSRFTLPKKSHHRGHQWHLLFNADVTILFTLSVFTPDQHEKFGPRLENPSWIPEMKNSLTRKYHNVSNVPIRFLETLKCLDLAKCLIPKEKSSTQV